MAITLSIYNRKGGTGKSTVSFMLAGTAAKSGNSVVVIDMDPQGSVTKGFLGKASKDSLPLKQTVTALFDRSVFDPDMTQLIRPTRFERLHLLPANDFLEKYKTPEPQKSGMDQFELREAIAKVEADFDLVIIDCPPDLSRLSWMSLIASDYILVPVPPEDFGSQELDKVHALIQAARQLNPGLHRLGHVITRRDTRLKSHEAYETAFRKSSPELFFQVVVPERSEIKSAITMQQPVAYCCPEKSDSVQAFDALWQEIRSKVERREKTKAR